VGRVVCLVAGRLLFPSESVANRSEIGQENSCRLSARLGSSRQSQGILARKSREFILFAERIWGVNEITRAYYGQFLPMARTSLARSP
jgi:hypothetical protein